MTTMVECAWCRKYIDLEDEKIIPAVYRWITEYVTNIHNGKIYLKATIQHMEPDCLGTSTIELIAVTAKSTRGYSDV